MIAAGTTFEAYWNTAFPGIRPLADALREHCADRWLRVHSHPDNRHFAESSAESSEMLFRQNAMGNRLLGPGAPCFLLTYDWEGAERLSKRRRIGVLGDVSARPWLRLPADDDHEGDVSVFGLETTWRAGAFNELLLDIAGEREQALWVAKESAAVFAPYDGGVDLIYPAAPERDADRICFASWINAHRQVL